ncbi:nuclease-related domain-containing protein [Virgibacillus byunsanensis]|uniref:Nuclease-related domain-containing protein n=1 Tax=Virgibacillus byunsanensis TaxID=570945 RepID=A0ABW3LNP3_9BACI
MISLLNLFKKKEEVNPKREKQTNPTNSKVATRKGEIGEYKIDIQLSQLPKEYLYVNDIMIKNTKSITGYSQIDHVVLTPYGIFIIETKNYQGTIYGGKNRKHWLINGNFKMKNPLIQNYGHIGALKLILDKKFHGQFISIVSFTKRCTLKIDPEIREISSDEIVIYDLYLSETIKRKVLRAKLKHKEVLLTINDIENMYRSLTEANITDTNLREEHTNSIKNKDQNNSKSIKAAKCVICHKTVSLKVKNYCLSNKKFNGKIYCYDHQK